MLLYNNWRVGDGNMVLIQRCDDLLNFQLIYGRKGPGMAIDPGRHLQERNKVNTNSSQVQIKENL